MISTELETFYNQLPKIQSEEFRNAVIQRCSWTYAVWLNKLRGITAIIPLEAEAIEIIMQSFKTTV